MSQRPRVVEMAHGSGGRASDELIRSVFLPALGQSPDQILLDYGCLPAVSGRLVMATDSHVISPIFFPGGNIGSLAVHGTLNDLAMSGATPLAISVAFILEEGFPIEQLETITRSLGEAARQCRVPVIAGDTKVVERGAADQVYIQTTGIGVLPEGRHLSPERIRPGDHVLVSGTLGDHGMAILTLREKLALDTPIQSDSAALQDLVTVMLDTADVHCLRDPTRGGLAAALNELAQASGRSIEIEEARLPIRPPVQAACELLGLEALHLANEGKLIAFCPASQSSALLNAMRSHPLGCEADLIGSVLEAREGRVQLRTAMGGERLVEWRHADPLPRIC